MHGLNENEQTKEGVQVQGFRFPRHCKPLPLNESVAPTRLAKSVLSFICTTI